jgi:hypothetical protein
MNRQEHARSCEAAFGDPFTAVHDFLDRYAEAFPRQHRKLYHHRRGLALIAERFGPEAVKAAEKHILEDEGTIPEDHTYYRAGSEELLRIVRETYPPPAGCKAGNEQ